MLVSCNSAVITIGPARAPEMTPQFGAAFGSTCHLRGSFSTAYGETFMKGLLLSLVTALQACDYISYSIEIFIFFNGQLLTQ